MLHFPLCDENMTGFKILGYGELLSFRLRFLSPDPYSLLLFILVGHNLILTTLLRKQTGMCTM
jgi:hypothetical protein